MKMTEEQQALAADNILFAYYLVNKWVNSQSVFDREALDRIASEAVCKAAVLYDPLRGSSFIHFAKQHINHTIAKKIRDKLSHDQIEDKAAKMEAIRRQFACQEEALVRNIDLYNALQKLSPRRKTIIMDHYFCRLSYKEIAIKYNMTLSQVKYALRESRKSLLAEIA